MKKVVFILFMIVALVFVIKGCWNKKNLKQVNLATSIPETLIVNVLTVPTIIEVIPLIEEEPKEFLIEEESVEVEVIPLIFVGVKKVTTKIPVKETKLTTVVAEKEAGVKLKEVKSSIFSLISIWQGTRR